MNYRRLGLAGLKLSELSLGSWVTFGGQINEETAKACMTYAYEAGVNFFDNAEAYAHGAAETMMGNILSRVAWRRSSYVVSTKFYFGLFDGPNDTGLSKKRLTEGIAGSLKRLRLEYVDLIFCHRPDPETPIEETVWAMDQIIRRGQSLYWGTSEWSAAQIMEAYSVARREHLHPPQMEQPQYHLFHRERVEVEYRPLYEKIGLGITSWSPLASGVLTGKYNDGIPKYSRLALPGYTWLQEEATPERIRKVKRLQTVAADMGCTVAQLAIAWCLKNPNVSTVITGASSVKQVKENMGAGVIAQQLTDEIMEDILKII